MSRPLRAAIIGVGRASGPTGVKGGGHRIGYTHAGMLARSPRTQLVAAADIDAANLEGFRATHPCTGYADYRVMLAQERPDIVCICTYVGLHERMIADCAAAGVRGIVCEKPYLDSPAAVARIDAILASTGCAVVVAHMRRHRPAFARVAELVRDGAIGLPVMTCAGIAGWDLSEWGSHWIDFFRQVHGDASPDWVMGQARLRGARGYGHAMEDHAVAVIAWPGGARAVLDGGKAMAGDASISIHGTEGMIRCLGEESLQIIGRSGVREESFAGVPAAGWEPLGLAPAASSWDTLWDRLLGDLLGWMDGGPVPALGHPRVRETALINLAAYISARTGDRIDWPLDPGFMAREGWPLEGAG
jgi:predicted dehydrogenase